MKELSLQEIKNVELQLLLQFHTVCQENGWHYSLSGGSLLGAVRHGGFIPWDDDVDVMMPRPDYDQFIEFSKKDLPYKLATFDTVESYNGLSAKMWDPSTLIEDSVLSSLHGLGVNIDVFPVEGLGDSEETAVKLFRKTEFDREILNGVLWKKYFRSKTHGLWLEPIRFAFFIISRFVNPKKLAKRIERINHRYSFNDSSYAGVVYGSYRMREILPQSTFAEYMDMEFEGYKLKVIKNYDRYLSSLYGDYMTLPPEEKRITHHTFKAFQT